jgi:glutamine amidotransferase
MITIVDYKLGGADKVAEALTVVGVKFRITRNENEIISSRKIILPGKEEAYSAVKKLHLFNLFNVLRIVKKPVLGIGLGMQLLSEFSKEGDVACLGKFPGIVKKFSDPSAKIPFNENSIIKFEKDNPLFKKIAPLDEFRFGNSFYLDVNGYTTATAFNGIMFTAAIEKDNFYGVQFHPEESGNAGLQLLLNFSEL